MSLFLVIPAALAFRHGAPAMHTAGPASLGAGCTACHSLNLGNGAVELIGVPRRYRAGQIYNIGVRISDLDQEGAGFEISAEKPGNHAGELLISDSLRTQYTDDGSGANSDFVTHTHYGVDDSVDNWDAGSGAYEYNLQWQAPATDDGSITFFASGNAINDAAGTIGDRYYFGYQHTRYAVPGDADADTDLDLQDFAAVQNCYLADTTGTDVCAFVSMTLASEFGEIDLAAFVDAYTGPVAENPGEYVLADSVRGGKLYDRWWQVNGAPEPIGDHPLYPPAGAQSGSVTFRCKECHGWDYQGVDGAYGAGSHFTGIAGILGTTRSAEEIFALLSADPNVVSDGHDMTAYGLSEGDLWDLTKFVREGLVDTDPLITSAGDFVGDPFFGSFYYGFNCSHCHGDTGTAINFGTAQEPEYIGTVANENPWEFMHKVRFGHPGAPMPATDLLGWPAVNVADLGAYAQTLPQ